MLYVGVVGVGGRVSLSPYLPKGWLASLGPPVWVGLIQDLVLYPHPVLGHVSTSSALDRDGCVAVVFRGSVCLVVRL